MKGVGCTAYVRAMAQAIYPTLGRGVSKSLHSRSPARTFPGTATHFGRWAREGRRIERARRTDRQNKFF